LKYHGTYQDKFGTEEIILDNDYKNFSFKLGDFNFIGRHLDDFELEAYDSYKQEQLKRFTFKPINIYQSDKKVYELKDFVISFVVPVTILNLTSKKVDPADLFVKIKVDADSVDNGTRIFLKIAHERKDFSGTGSFFEIAADQINKQIDGAFVIKNCFWCLYSDYSVYGQGLAGSMLCFLKYKDKYLKVKSKDEYIELPNDIPLVQEIYHCDSFEPRKPGTGYRG
jgi:hypothetical protein